jgi:hypothetical protein
MIRPPNISTVLLPFRKGPHAGPPLRVGVVCPNRQPQPWVSALLSFLGQLPGIEVILLASTGQPRAASARPSWLTGRLYSKSREIFDPFGDLAALRGSVLCDNLQAAECGILLWLDGAVDPGLHLDSVTRHGACTVRFGKNNRLIPYWDEVANSEATSTIALYWHESSLTRGRAVRIAETSTSLGLYVTENFQEPMEAAIRMLATLCLDVRDDASSAKEKLRGYPELPLEPLPDADLPSTWETATFAVRKLARSAQLRSKSRSREPHWFVAMRPNSGVSITDPNRTDMTGFKEIPLPPGTQMADPFLWETGERSYLLYEEIPPGSRGRLGCVEVLKDGSCTERKVILERPYHLSYPCVVPAQGELFLLPEAAESGNVDLYRFREFPWELERVRPLVEGLALVDTTPILLDDRWYFFTTTAPPFLETLLFWSDRLDGDWKLHPSSPISASVRNSRSAGNLFWRDGKLYRPTQDCSESYGYAMQINEVTSLTPTLFEERRINWIPPTWYPELLCTHTWNESSRLQVIDGIRLREKIV